MNKNNKSYVWIFQAGLFFLILIFMVPYFTKQNHYGILDYADLAIHEAGHNIFFVLFGEFIRVFGGTLSQLIIPLVFAIYFFLMRKDLFAGMITMLWFFQSMINVSVYMRDARFMILPLFGDPEMHDWNYLFGKMKLLHQSVEIADWVKSIALPGILISIGIIIVYLILTSPFNKKIRDSQT